MTFYIGFESGSGMKCNTKRSFFRYLTDYIKTAEENNKEEFDRQNVFGLGQENKAFAQ